MEDVQSTVHVSASDVSALRSEWEALRAGRWSAASCKRPAAWASGSLAQTGAEPEEEDTEELTESQCELLRRTLRVAAHQVRGSVPPVAPGTPATADVAGPRSPLSSSHADVHVLRPALPADDAGVLAGQRVLHLRASIARRGTAPLAGPDHCEREAALLLPHAMLAALLADAPVPVSVASPDVSNIGQSSARPHFSNLLGSEWLALADAANMLLPDSGALRCTSLRRTAPTSSKRVNDPHASPTAGSLHAIVAQHEAPPLAPRVQPRINRATGVAAGTHTRRALLRCC